MAISRLILTAGELRPLRSEICWRVCGTRAHFDGFRVLASLLHRRRLTEVNQTLHDVWSSPVLVYYICILVALAPNTFLPAAKFTLRPTLAFFYIATVTARHSSTGVGHSLRRGTRTGITELSRMAPPIFGREAITLGNFGAPAHFNFVLFVSFFFRLGFFLA